MKPNRHMILTIGLLLTFIGGILACGPTAEPTTVFISNRPTQCPSVTYVPVIHNGDRTIIFMIDRSASIPKDETAEWLTIARKVISNDARPHDRIIGIFIGALHPGQQSVFFDSTLDYDITAIHPSTLPTSAPITTLAPILTPFTAIPGAPPNPPQQYAPLTETSISIQTENARSAERDRCNVLGANENYQSDSNRYEASRKAFLDGVSVKFQNDDTDRATEILEALYLSADIMGKIQGEKQIVIFSDMIQASQLPGAAQFRLDDIDITVIQYCQSSNQCAFYKSAWDQFLKLKRGARSVTFINYQDNPESYLSDLFGATR